MTDNDLNFILAELDAAHLSNGYAAETTYSYAAKTIRKLVAENVLLRESLTDIVTPLLTSE